MVNGDRRLLADIARIGAPPREPASIRLERELGPEFARRLVRALERAARDGRGRGPGGLNGA